MKGENIQQKKTRLKKEMESFRESKILLEDGKYDINKYHTWFNNYIAANKKDSIDDIISAMDDANFIAQESMKEKGIPANEDLKDGGMKNDELGYFILTHVPEKNVIKEVQNVLDKNKEEKDPEASLIKVCILLKPLFDEAQEKINNNSANANILKELQSDCSALLEKNGFNKKQIDTALKTVLSSKVEFVKVKAKEEKYNAYNDWRFIYYMSCLGAGYALNYDKTQSLLQMIAKDEKKTSSSYEKNTEKENMNALNFHKEKKTDLKFYDDQYLLEAIKLKSAFGVDFDSRELRDAFKGINNRASFKECFQNNLKKIFDTARGDKINTPDFIEQYNKMIMNLALSVDMDKYALADYGGMDEEEIYTFSMGLCDKKYNISARLEKDLYAKYGHIEKMDGALLTDILERKFTSSYNNAVLEDEEDDSKREAMACYLLLEKTHNKRTMGYKIRHPLDYRKETRVLEHMKNTIDQELENNHENGELREMLENHTVYAHGFDDERNRLRTFSIIASRTTSLFNPAAARPMEIEIDNEERVNNFAEERENENLINTNTREGIVFEDAEEAENS